MIDRKPLIDANRADAIRDVALHGHLEFANVQFAFPSRPDQMVLKGVSVRIEAGMVVGVVGSSGAGKSTLVALLERFHDCTSGQVLRAKVFCLSIFSDDVRRFESTGFPSSSTTCTGCGVILVWSRKSPSCLTRR